MAHGIVKWFTPRKGYGLIRPNDGRKDVFVHIEPHARGGDVRLNQDELKRAVDAAAHIASRSVDASRLKSS
jgi:cold shock CspA family protein